MNREELLEKLLEDKEFLTELHKAWFWGEYGDKLLLFYSLEREYWYYLYMPQNEWFQKEPEELIGYVVCPGWNNIDSSMYEEGVGYYNNETGRYEWDPMFLFEFPEYKNIIPTWTDIINASIELGDWEDWEEELAKMFFEK